MNSLTRAALCAAPCLLIAPAAAQSVLATPEIATALRISRGELQELAVPMVGGDEELVFVEVLGAARPLVLRRHSVRSADFRLLVQTDFGMEEHTPLPPTTYRGYVAGVPESSVVASLVDGELTAKLLLPGPREVWIQPDPTQAGPGRTTHVVYAAGDVIPGDETCGTDTPSGPGRFEDEAPDSGRLNLDGECYSIADLAMDTDFEFFQALGSSVANVVSFIEGQTNQVEAIYRDHTEIVYELGTIIVRSSSSDPYVSTSSGCGSPGLLQEFQSEWNSNQGGVKRDVAGLFTGKDLDGNIIGCAFGPVVCNLGGAYGVNQILFSGNANSRTGLFAHELGHNWSAGHCDGDAQGCAIMCSFIGGCSANLTVFAPVSDIAISNFRSTRTCLSDVVHVDLAATGDCHGTSEEPYDTLTLGATCSMSAWPMREVRIAPGTYDEGVLVIDRHVRLEPVGGIVRVE